MSYQVGNKGSNSRNSSKKTIVVSAVNIRKGGTLTILRQCLEYLSEISGQYRVVALVHDRELCEYAGIEYMEFPDTIKGWARRLWCEYVSMRKVSRQLAPVELWMSLHDTTPNVESVRQVVYCQTSFPFMRWKWCDLRFDYKIALFTILTKWVYRVNVRRNRFLVVQASWLRDGLSSMLGVDKEKFVIFPPSRPDVRTMAGIKATKMKIKTFLFASTPDCHKNFETLCEASRILESRIGKDKFKVVLTIKGTENKYASWLHKEWKKTASLDFRGLLPREELFQLYASIDCLICPSRVETWGLPISEFSVFGRPMLLADLPYAHETAAGCKNVGFFNPYSPDDLADRMEKVVYDDLSGFCEVEKKETAQPCVQSWAELFNLLLK